MTTLRIPPLAGGRAKIQLVDAAESSPVLGFDGPEWATAYEALPLDTEQQVELTPTADIATAGGGATAYLVTVTASGGRTVRHLVQMPDSPAEQELADLVAAAAIDPADIVAGRLLPLTDEHTQADVLTLDADLVPTWSPVPASPTGWDDLRAPASMINPAGSASPPDAYEDGSLLFAANAIEQIAVLLQMPHAWAGTDVRPHIHWCKTTDAAGDVIWELRHRVLNKGEVAPAWSAWAPISGRSETITADQRMLIDRWADIGMTGAAASSMLSLELRRNGPDAGDTYGADARLWELDVHYQVASFGSVAEYPD